MVNSSKKKIIFLAIYGQDNSLSDKKRRRREQYSVINNLIRLGVPISQEILYQENGTKLKVGKKFLCMLQPPCVDSKLKFYNVRFDMLKHGTF